MKTLASQPSQSRSLLNPSKIGFSISLVIHCALAYTLFDHFHNFEVKQDGDNVMTIALATFQNPSEQEKVENPKPNPTPQVKKQKHHKEVFKETGKLANAKNETKPSESPKAKQDTKQEEGELIQTLSYKDGKEDEIFGKIKRAIDRKNKYPSIARKRGLEGEVVVEFIIYENGKVGEIQVTKPCPYEPFNTAAVNAIKKAQNDFPILSLPTKIEIPIVYKLERN